MNGFLRRIPIRSLVIYLVLGLVLILALSACRARKSTLASEIPDISLVLTAGGFTQPTGIAHAGDGSGRLFIVEQGGLVKIIKHGTVIATPFLNISSLLKSSAGEQGLLGIAFPRGYGPGKNHL